MRIWLLPDTHLGHRKLEAYCNRPPDFENLILSNCKKMIRREDLLIHMGDVALYWDEMRVRKYFAEIPGHKILVRGNHDHWSASKYLNIFDSVLDGVLLKGVVMTHHRCVSHMPNIHAHGHMKSGWYLPEICQVSLEDNAYCPFNLDKVISERNKNVSKD